MVLGLHIDGASLGLPKPSGSLEALTAREIWQLGAESLCIVGVNCFTMISGYFGIRLTVKNVGSYLFECIFYSVGIYSLAMILFPASCSWNGWIESWMILSHSDLWYVPAYFLLMLFSPILNGGLDKLSCRQTGYILLGLTLFNIWCGWWWNGNFNPTGYTIMQLILIYIAGGYIRRYVHIKSTPFIQATLACGYVLSALAVAVSAIYLPSLKAFAYNSPLVMAETVFLFLLFLTMHFQSRTVNRIAKGAFAVYLIHKAPIVWVSMMKPAVISLWQATPLWVFVLSSIGLSIAIYIFGALIDMVRQRISKLIF